MMTLSYILYAILLFLTLAFLHYKDEIIKWSVIAYKTIPRDLRGLSCLLRYRYRLWRFKKANGTIAGLFFSRSLRKWADNIAFIYEDSQWTYTDVATYANAVALYFYENQMHNGEDQDFSQLKVGDTVALFMESRPEFICTWLGLSRIGIKSALINYNLRNETLLNSLNALPIKAIIYGTELEGALQEILPKLEPSVKLLATSPCWRSSGSKQEGESNESKVLRQPIDKSFKLGTPLPDNAVYKAKTRHEILFYIYTSGTTGMPKAAIVSHVKYHYLTYLVSRTLKIRQDDRIYTALPLYHTAGGIVGVGQSLLLGNTVVIKKKFSASKFWEECIKYECTVAQYIGEICRYLLNQPPKDTDHEHKVRLMYGNGLRIQIWKEFVERFNIAEIGEFYGATESNANMVNMDNTFGAVGFNSPIFPGFLPITLIRVSETGVPLRNSHGLCILCKPGQPGELVGKIIKSDPVKSFQGYSDREATRKKVVTNVFRKGDAAFLTGDILVQDEFGYFYFKDRTGDTYRWKGENVSTLEVENVVSGKLENKDVVVYGVTISDMDGKAGMAAILDPENKVDVDKLAKDLTKSLPVYSRPVFLRILKKIDLTSTFKPKKNELAAQGFDPAKVEGDPLYYLDPQTSSYRPLSPSVFEEILGHKIRL